jgi:hypothetical protein
MQPLYVMIATALDALRHCESDAANEMQQAFAPHWRERLAAMRYELPRGSGFDSYPVIDTDEIRPERITITGSFHDMDDSGSYCGCTNYTVTVKPSLVHGFLLSVRGGNADLREYIGERFANALRTPYEPDAFEPTPVATGDV